MKMFYKGMYFVFFDFETTGIEARGREESDDDPIQLGMILTDENLLIRETTVFSIYWPWMDRYNEWPILFQDAYNIHKIKLSDLRKYGYSLNHVWMKINSFLKVIPENTKMKPTLVSDNAYFDTLMMHKLFNAVGKEFPFHYTTWDINILYTSMGVKKTIKHSHDALDDAANMYHRTLRSLEKAGYWK